MGRFASTVAYYETARPPYGAAFFEAVALQLGLDGSERLLDVGAGPGILAIGFAPYCREVVGWIQNRAWSRLRVRLPKAPGSR
jgi:cyclopropane fatty-acyl-phospholipid synthase-like methyltransferase